jgi:hypothetical protein
MPLKLSPTQIAFNARGDGKFNKPFTEQADFFRQKLNLPTERWDDILNEAHDRAFVVAGAAKADLLNDLRSAVDSAIAEGKSIQWFRKEFDNIVAKNGWQGWTGEGTKAGRDWRTRVIYQTNLSASYAAGRYRQLTDPDLLKSRPFWKYVHNDTVRNPRPLHQSWSGTVLRYDDPFWQTHFPPNGWGCRCRITAVRESEYKGHPPPDDGTYLYKSRDGQAHVLPKGIDYGWGYTPGASVGKTMQPFIDNKVAALPKPLADAFKADIAQLAAPKLPHVSDVLTLPSSGFARSAATRTLVEIDAIHTVDNLPTIPVKASTSVRFQGQYTYERYSKKPISISLSKVSVNPELTIAHEIGHYIDHHAIGRSGVYASIDDALLDNWRQAIASSQATAKMDDVLRNHADHFTREKASYYLEPWEQWARAYAQWIALRSNNATMLAQVKKITANTHHQAYAASQWDDVDFAPIAAAMDEIFNKLRWLK